MSITVATGSHRFLCGARLFCGLKGKQRSRSSALTIEQTRWRAARPHPQAIPKSTALTSRLDPWTCTHPRISSRPWAMKSWGGPKRSSPQAPLLAIPRPSSRSWATRDPRYCDHYRASAVHASMLSSDDTVSCSVSNLLKPFGCRSMNNRQRRFPSVYAVMYVHEPGSMR